jgi:integrase
MIKPAPRRTVELRSTSENERVFASRLCLYSAPGMRRIYTIVRPKPSTTVLRYWTCCSRRQPIGTRVACTIRCFRSKALGRFYDSDEYERLIQAAKSLDRKTHVIVLFGGEAGLRYEEIMILEWQDVDLQKQQLRVQRSDWKGHVA